MTSEALHADSTQRPAKAAAVSEPISILDLMVVVLAVGASSLLWLWFTSPKLHYIWNLAIPMLVLFTCGVVAPMLVAFVGGLAGLFKLAVPRLTVAPETHRRYMYSRRRKYYAFAVLFAAAAMVSIMFHVPLYARFELSRPAMNAFVASLHENPDATLPATMRVGSFVIETSPQQRRDGALMFHLAGDNEVGFTYSTTPIGYPGFNRGDGGRLGGGWYWFSDD